MRTSKIILPFVGIALLTVSCGNDYPTINDIDDNLICIEAVHPNSGSRTSDTGFDSGDRIGVYVADKDAVLQPGGNMVNNGCYEYNGSTWQAERKYYWNEGTYNVYAYYPYQASIDVTDEYSFKLPLDQSTKDGYQSADFLWASAPGVSASNESVKLKFSHIMSNILVNIVKADNYEGELPTDLQVYIHGTYTTTNIDLSTGGAVADSRSGMETIKARKLSNTQFLAVVAPQRIDSRRPLVEVTTGNVSYLMEGVISLKPGYRHTVTISLSKSPEQVEIEIGGGIGSWN